MSDLVLAGGTVVTAEGSFRADVAVSGETIDAIGVDLPRDGAEVVDVSGARVMPGFIDGHTHMDMPFGGTVTADDWDTGTAAALAGGTTMLVDFSLQDPESTLADAVETWHGKADGKAHIDYGFHVAITNLTEDVKKEIPSLPGARRGDDQDLHGLQGHAAVHGGPGPVRGDADRARGRRARARARRERRRDRQPAGAGARGRQHRAALPRAHPPGGGRGGGDQPRDPPRRGGRLAAPGRARLVREGAGGGARARTRAGRPVYAETCPQYLVFSYDELAQDGFEGAKYVLSPPLRDKSNQPALWHGLQTQDLHIFGSDHCSFNYAKPEGAGRATTSR